jgi:hypothetical protein
MIPKVGGFFRMGGAIFPPVVDGDCAMCDFIIEVREDMLARCAAIAEGIHNEYVGDGFERERFALSLVSTCLRALQEKP